jgi:hypothetical protein
MGVPVDVPANAGRCTGVRTRDPGRPGRMGVTERVRSTLGRARRAAHREAEAYRHGAERPLAPYVGTMVTYGGSVALLAGVGAVAGARLPETVSPWDVTLLGVATYKVSRLVAKDTVTAPLRAPFTEFQGPQGEAEPAEQVRGRGLRHAVGELVSCPFCLAQWVATGFAAGLVFAPQATRVVAATFTAVAASDMLQNAYALLQQKATGKGTYEPRPVEVRFDGVTNREPDLNEGLPDR